MKKRKADDVNAQAKKRLRDGLDLILVVAPLCSPVVSKPVVLRQAPRHVLHSCSTQNMPRNQESVVSGTRIFLWHLATVQPPVWLSVGVCKGFYIS